ncbi:synaptophysin-like protein 1 [Anomaloglossus baeobatrachus]|uniref:synaptophysin-like protein 1 n=1 Tax=Anomaloglossus baeobatrachus TaxID=238106 RepID=UPI003F4FA8D0
MYSLTQKMSGLQLNFSPLKEPLGFIKVLEWFFSIFSFATCGGYSGKTSIYLSCNNNKTENLTLVASFGYPFRLNNVKFDGYKENYCDDLMKEWHLSGDFSSSAEFYVTIAALAFLYCIGALVVYLGFRHLYQNPSKLPLIDFIITVIFAFMWLVSSSAWAKGLTDIKTVTSPDHLVKEQCVGRKFQCSEGTESRMGSLNISVAFGFLNLILWAGNAWFAYKETNLHTPPPEPSNPEQGVPPSSM